jgi:tRNA dimethylallyltransferase
VIPTVIIAGPTASGKSAVALELAMACRGEIVCADSMQVYRDLDVLSARPSAADEARVPHHLYGKVDGAERYSAGRFVREARAVIEDIKARRRLPILCGGTGLYLKALTEGVAPIPEVPKDITLRLNEEWDLDAAAFRRELLKADSAMERLDPADRQRHIRALGVLRSTGRPLSEWQAAGQAEAPAEGPYLGFVLGPPREALYARIEGRFDTMLERGAREEVASLMQRDLDPALPVMKALGVREVAAIAEGASEAEMIAAAKQETRRFAKRQMTWFRNQTSWPSYERGPDLVVAALHALGVTSSA